MDVGWDMMIPREDLVKAFFLQWLIDISQIYHNIERAVKQPSIRKEDIFKVEHDHQGLYHEYDFFDNHQQFNKPGIVFQALRTDI